MAVAVAAVAKHPVAVQMELWEATAAVVAVISSMSTAASMTLAALGITA